MKNTVFSITPPSKRLTAVVAGACAFAFCSVSEAQIKTIHGYTVDTDLAAPTINTAYSIDGTTFTNNLFGDFIGFDGTGQLGTRVLGNTTNGQLDPYVSAYVHEGFGTYYATAKLSYQFIVLPDALADLGAIVTVDVLGQAANQASPLAFFDSVYAPTAQVTLSGPGFPSDPAPFVDVDSLIWSSSSGGGVTDNFDNTFDLVAGDTYTLTLYASAGYSADPSEIIDAYVDPQAIIDPVFALDHPGFQIAFSPGFPGNSYLGLPESGSTFAWLSLTAVFLVLLRRFRAAA
jgi:hypothetical protein